MEKPIVHYKAGSLEFYDLGLPAFLFPTDHPSPHVTNTGKVRTSPVISHDTASGNLETENTRYRPVP